MGVEFSFSEKEALNKLAKYCAYQDRSSGEVMQKLNSFKIYGENANKIIEFLKVEKFLDDKRFVNIYIKSKIRFKHWGRNKIFKGLKSKFAENEIINEALSNLDLDEYNMALKEVIEKKTKELGGELNFENNNKIIRYAQSKGFTISEILKYLNNKDDDTR
ncbi:MAG: hypothetical protein AUJ98_00855 [Bacteroidetes bacterium CG2_30_33_31]|nr:MAG: hypothetical protein AUJ98_00855 [Bacteroidetes bacterium CG2_30_33_31]